MIDHVLNQISKKLKNCDTLCTICNVDERMSCKKWYRLNLSCDHTFHSKCLRKYCFEKKQVSCPICKLEIKLVNKNKYCSRCDNFGHHTTDCKKLENFEKFENERDFKVDFIIDLSQ